MEKDIKLGSVGDIDLKQEGGVASATVSLVPIKAGPVSFEGSVKISLDEKAMLEMLIAKYGETSILGEILKTAQAALPLV